MQKFTWSLKFFWLFSVLSFKNSFLNLDHFIIALWSSLVIKDASLARTHFLLIGAYLLNILKTVTVNNILEKMSKALNKHIDYTDKNLLILLGARTVVFFLFTTVIGTPIRIASASISLLFPTSNGIVKMFLTIWSHLPKKSLEFFLCSRRKK